jgi:hypothetical protein
MHMEGYHQVIPCQPRKLYFLSISDLPALTRVGLQLVEGNTVKTSVASRRAIAEDQEILEA